MKKLLTILLVLSTLFINGQRCCRVLPPTPDADATAFLTATGITDPTISSAIYDLVSAAKTHGWWSLKKAIYPMVGGTLSTCKWNLKDPRDLDAAFRLTIPGTYSASAAGLKPDGSNLADTHLNPSTDLASPNSTSMSYYINEGLPPGSGNCEMGTQTTGNVNERMAFSIDYSATSFLVDYYYYGTSRIFVAEFASTGYYEATVTTSTRLDIYLNGTSVANSTGAVGTPPNATISIGGAATLGATLRRCAGSTIGNGINSTIASDEYNDWLDFNTALSRN